MKGFDAAAIAPEAVPGVHLLPVVHDRVELAAVVRATLDALDPAAVAVELPTPLAAAAEQAVARLPRVSLVLSEQPGEPALVWVVAPGDPLAEALRWARERGRERLCIDPDVPYAERHADRVPDPYAAWSLGAASYLGALVEAAAAGAASEADRARERGMAFHLARARARHRSVLAVVGAAHVRRLAVALAGPTATPLARARRQRVEVRHLHPESLTGLLPDPPLAHAAWELLRGGEPIPAATLESAVARRISLWSHGLRLLTREPLGHGERRQRLVAHAAGAAGRALCGGVRAPDRAALQRVVWEVATRSWQEQTEELAQRWQRRIFFDYARRHARLQGLLEPGLYEWVVAARGVADDNLAWETFEAARAYPWQEELAEIATARVDGDELDLGTRRVRFRRRFFRAKRRLLRVPVHERPQSDDPAEWLQGFDGEGICSYPPEDVVVEDYGRFLQRKAVAVLSAERRKSEPFSGSLLDGIDLRETMRRRVGERAPGAARPPGAARIWVQENGRAPGQAGSVVVVFEPAAGDRFPHRMTWHGEHDQESDMAFYSSEPTEQVVGPGILRATYGGFLMTYPPGRLLDVWHDEDYRGLPAHEVLLAAAVDYSLEKLVVHVAREAPGDRWRRYAAAQGKRIVHLPLGALSPVTLRRLRVVHLLAGRDKRAIARDYVW
jgi:hypothetical protein